MSENKITLTHLMKIGDEYEVLSLEVVKYSEYEKARHDKEAYLYFYTTEAEKNEKLQKENAKLKLEIDTHKLTIERIIGDRDQLKEKFARAVKCIEFYGDKRNWEYWHNSDVGSFKDWNTFRPEVHCGGKLARQTLEEIK